MKYETNQNPFPGFRRVYIKNFFIYPNILEEYWRTMSSSEHLVLTFILRQTIGFRKECDYISLSQFSKGIGGASRNRGTGLSISQVRRAIDGLERKGFIRVTRFRNRPSKFCLVFEKVGVDFDAEKAIKAFRVDM